MRAAISGSAITFASWRLSASTASRTSRWRPTGTRLGRETHSTRSPFEGKSTPRKRRGFVIERLEMGRPAGNVEINNALRFWRHVQGTDHARPGGGLRILASDDAVAIQKRSKGSQAESGSGTPEEWAARAGIFERSI